MKGAATPLTGRPPAKEDSPLVPEGSSSSSSSSSWYSKPWFCGGVVGALCLVLGVTAYWIHTVRSAPSEESVHGDCATHDNATVYAQMGIIQRRIELQDAFADGERLLGGSNTLDSCEVVVSTQEMQGVSHVRANVPSRCRVTVYDKAEDPQLACYNNSAALMPPNTFCRYRRNVGREFETYLNHVLSEYDALPDRLYMTTGQLSRHGRSLAFQNMILSTVLQDEMPTPAAPDDFWCIRQMRLCEGFSDKPLQNLSQYQSYGMLEYVGSNPTPAAFRPLGPFVLNRIGSQACQRTCTTGVCHYGMLMTTRENIHAHPRSVYASMMRDFPRDANSPEAGFFLEMMAELAFGYRVSANHPLRASCDANCTPTCPNSVSRTGHATCADDPLGADPNGPWTNLSLLWPSD